MASGSFDWSSQAPLLAMHNVDQPDLPLLMLVWSGGGGAARSATVAERFCVVWQLTLQMQEFRRLIIQLSVIITSLFFVHFDRSFQSLFSRSVQLMLNPVGKSAFCCVSACQASRVSKPITGYWPLAASRS